MRRSLNALLTAALLFAIARPAHAAVNVTRAGDENPMKEVAKSVLYGGLAGLTVGLAIAAVHDGDDENTIRWGFAGGAFAGAGLGLYFVLSRPSADALLEIENGRMRLALAAPTIAPGPGVRLTVMRAKF